MSAEAIVNQTSGSAGLANQILPVDPFRSLYVHFGMLLGVDDFQTLDAYHRGKMWYHNAWLHGEGVVWGLDVVLPHIDDPESDEIEFSGEIKVSAGLAMDGVGRELLLEHAACLNLAAWYAANQDDVELQQVIEIDEESGDIIFDAHVTLEFQACLSRQVPALSESCDASSTSTAYSRVVETVKVILRPGEYQSPHNTDYYRLNLLFGLAQPREDEDGAILESDADVLAAKAEILAADENDKAALCQKWFTHFAVLDGITLKPDTTIGTTQFASFPQHTPAKVLLANLKGLRLHKQDDEWQLIAGDVDPFVRPYLLPTSAIQNLLCGAIHPDAEIGESTPDAPSGDAGGPRIDAESVTMQGTELIKMKVVGSPLMKASADAKGITVSAFDTRDGWVSCDIKQVTYDTSDNSLHVELRDAPAGVLVRLIVKGTGETPILGRNRIPLAGGVDSPAGTAYQGNDFIYMFKTRSGS
ncbi:hypothetical protein [Aliiglaciecola lipolytica]|uniref:Uncharacterized protein n=1 Tax=Aliiglaciecola lipolytica E3 TaxID=1127673 RepID=K6YNW2_9ALTE|nr:hypothetical protein [Aliiglaciecola lipolytica]GAC13040.1 hypothetical protein GLIP_0393 [Aliiglaciecola lipolytica E3]